MSLFLLGALHHLYYLLTAFAQILSSAVLNRWSLASPAFLKVLERYKKPKVYIKRKAAGFGSGTKITETFSRHMQKPLFREIIEIGFCDLLGDMRKEKGKMRSGSLQANLNSSHGANQSSIFLDREFPKSKA